MTTIHDLRLKTSLSYEHIDDILAGCCLKLYSMTLDDIEESSRGQRKVLRISFEDPADRERFRVSYQKSRDEAASPLLPQSLNVTTPTGAFGTT